MEAKNFYVNSKWYFPSYEVENWQVWEAACSAERGHCGRTVSGAAHRPSCPISCAWQAQSPWCGAQHRGQGGGRGQARPSSLPATGLHPHAFPVFPPDAAGRGTSLGMAQAGRPTHLIQETRDVAAPCASAVFLPLMWAGAPPSACVCLPGTLAPPTAQYCWVWPLPEGVTGRPVLRMPVFGSPLPAITSNGTRSSRGPACALLWHESWGWPGLRPEVQSCAASPLLGHSHSLGLSDSGQSTHVCNRFLPVYNPLPIADSDSFPRNSGKQLWKGLGRHPSDSAPSPSLCSDQCCLNPNPVLSSFSHFLHTC